MASSVDTLDQRFLRSAKGVAVPPHTETDRTVLAHPITARGGNPHVHDHHLWTEEDHLANAEFNELDFVKRGWRALLIASFAGMLLLFIVMIARG
jgi:hypothetical protein